ncbi:MAG: hypothetical protein Q9218_001397 [Villophora microphyllina]
MSDSVRKSSRATKGQHTKNFDTGDTPTTKRGKKGKGSKAAKQAAAEATTPEEEEGDAIIRCICGYVVEDEDDERKMIVCDNCEAWQHNECMEMSLDDKELPEQYFCEECRPDLHRELLDKMARGVRPWEERARQRELEEEQERERKRRKKGKKGGRPSGVKPAPPPAPAPEPEPEHDPAKSNGVPDTPLTAVPPATPVEPEPPVEATQKRKFPDDSPSEVKTPSQQEPQSKVRKVSSSAEQKPPIPAPRRKSSAIATPTHTSGKAAPPKRDSKPPVMLQMELVGNISDLHHETRQRCASALVKLFVAQTKQALKEGSFNPSGNQSPDTLGNTLGLAVEYAMFLNFWGTAAEPSSNYGEKFRTINHNVKQNPALRNRLLTGELSPNDFSKMSTHDMASKDLQEKTAEMKRAADKQAILVEQQGPRIRRTHKGEEFVEAPDGQGPSAPDMVFSAPIGRARPVDETDIPKQTSPEPTSPQSPPQPVELPENVGTAMASPMTAPPLSVDTKVPPKPERQASSNFNIQDVWSSVTGPDADGQKLRQSFPPPEKEQAVDPTEATGGSGDADIDRLLKDEEQEEEEPYSPTEYPADPNAPVWHGKLAMLGVTEFSGEGKHVAGANLSATIPWAQIMAPTMNIEGRIPIERASEYLCGLRYSSSTDVSVVAITPSDNEDSKTAFDKLFHYFVERKRYGVVGKSGTKEVKDIYLAPLEAGASTKPEFLELLEHCTIPNPVPERMLLMPFVIRAHNSPTTGGPESTPRPLDTAAVASPVNAGNFQTPTPFPAPTPPVGYHGSPTAAGPYHNSPPQHQGGFQGSPSQHPQHHYGLPAQQQQQLPYNTQPPFNGPVGLEAAKQALGDMINAPTVAPLLHDAPGAGVYELGFVRDLFEQVPATKENWEMLKTMLAMKLREAGGGGA